jgi:oligo-1,6-glucosidase
MKFWAEKGVDGFRLDAFQFVSKDVTFPPLPEGYHATIPNVIKHHGMGPHLHTYLKEMNDEVLSKYDVFAVSEGVGSSLEDAHAIVDEDRGELQMAYHFESTDLVSSLDKCTLAEIKECFTKWDTSFDKKGWLSIYLSNHDQARMVNRFGNAQPAYKEVSAKMLNTFILSMKGTPFTYYGDELGMTNNDFKEIEEYRDIAALNGYKTLKAKGGDIALYLKTMNLLSRDNGRTPMQWDASKNSGFSAVKPWLPVHENHTTVNVATQEKDANSVLNHFKKMVLIRNKNLILVYGKYTLIQKSHKTIYAYTRVLKEEKILVLLNFSEKKSTITISILNKNLTVLINNYDAVAIFNNTAELAPYQAIIIKL